MLQRYPRNSENYFNASKSLCQLGHSYNIPGILGSIAAVLGGKATTEVASLLLERGADVNDSMDTGPGAGFTCLMMAARNARPDLVEFLLANGADITAKTKDGSTALSLALEENDEQTAALLRANGATE